MIKKNNTNNINNITNLSVSIVTITQLYRFDSLNILIDLIKNQSYSNIIEWIIVEGSKNSSDAEINKININNLIKNTKSSINFIIKYIEYKPDTKLGELRNNGNLACTGDITVCMDDDDYYPPTRVSHAVKKLSESNYKIAGCSNHYMYDYNLKMLVQMKIYAENHSSNSCMAWKKEYLKTNSHDPKKDVAEEASFTKNFTEPMIKLEPEHTIIMSSHNKNTFSKKKLFLSLVNGIKCSVDKIIKKPIKSFIPVDIFNRYDQIFNKNDDNFNYDIVYMCGAFSIKWDPFDKKLGGSEQAVVNLSEQWVKQGKKVIVYGEIPELTINGVDYKPWQQFNYNIRYKNLILWRIFGLMTVLPFNIKADFIGFDVHDNFLDLINEKYKQFKKYADKIFLKSNYHKKCFLELIDSDYDINKFVIISNGVRIEKFLDIQKNLKTDNSIQRNPYRFCYCSCYKRGLDIIISKIWSIIYNYEPRAELHVYYGMNNITNDKYQQYLQCLLSQPGVMDHGRQPVEIIYREKNMSTYHLYLTNTQAEIDCISIKESIFTDCIPIISNFGVFKEREGIHFDFDNDTQIKMAAIKIIDLLKNPDKLEFYKKSINKSDIVDWDKTASDWNSYFV